jgi:hypothetical protein
LKPRFEAASPGPSVAAGSSLRLKTEFRILWRPPSWRASVRRHNARQEGGRHTIFFAPLVIHRSYFSYHNGEPKRPRSSKPRLHRSGIRSRKKQMQEASPGASSTQIILSFGIFLSSTANNRGTTWREPHVQ